MAYSDYGGYAFRNGERVVERSDFTITPEGGYGTPGAWPGFVQTLAGDVEVRHPYAHAVLGDGPLFVALYKQSSVLLYIVHDGAIRRLDLDDYAPELPVEKYGVHDGKRYLDIPFAFTGDTEATRFEVAGHTIDVRWMEEDNFYQYVRLTQPDGTTWTGWAGYGVGAGLEDCDYGYNTEERTRVLDSIFPPLSPHSREDSNADT